MRGARAGWVTVTFSGNDKFATIVIVDRRFFTSKVFILCNNTNVSIAYFTGVNCEKMSFPRRVRH